MKNLLFICSRNRLRSPTAEAIFAAYEDLAVESAGLSPDAEMPVTSEAIAWADVIFVMERFSPRRQAERTRKS